MKPTDALPDGYTMLRPLSERNGSVVYLAINPTGHHCCLKIQHTTKPGALGALIRVRQALAAVIASDGFIPVREWGVHPTSNCLWEEMDLADDSVTGQPYDQFAVEALFRPLGIERWWFQFYDGDERHGRHPSH